MRILNLLLRSAASQMPKFLKKTLQWLLTPAVIHITTTEVEMLRVQRILKTAVSRKTQVQFHSWRPIKETRMINKSKKGYLRNIEF